MSVVDRVGVEGQSIWSGGLWGMIWEGRKSVWGS